MALAYTISQSLVYNYKCKPLDAVKIKLSSDSEADQTNLKSKQRSDAWGAKPFTLTNDADNSPTACSFHGHATGILIIHCYVTNSFVSVNCYCLVL